MYYPSKEHTKKLSKQNAGNGGWSIIIMLRESRYFNHQNYHSQ